MEKVITVSDILYNRLEESASKRNLSTIEELLELWISEEEEIQKRTQQVENVYVLHDRLLQTYGVFPDSVTLIREDRER
jgi:hypothetical protein